jgi:hypothetical protein
MRNPLKVIGSVAGCLVAGGLYFAIFNPAALGAVVAEQLGIGAFHHLPESVRAAYRNGILRDIGSKLLVASQKDPEKKTTVDVADNTIRIKYVAGLLQQVDDRLVEAIQIGSCSDKLRPLIDLGIEVEYQYWQAERMLLGLGEPKLVKTVDVTSCEDTDSTKTAAQAAQLKASGAMVNALLQQAEPPVALSAIPESISTAAITAQEKLVADLLDARPVLENLGLHYLSHEAHVLQLPVRLDLIFSIDTVASKDLDRHLETLSDKPVLYPIASSLYAVKKMQTSPGYFLASIELCKPALVALALADSVSSAIMACLAPGINVTVLEATDHRIAGAGEGSLLQTKM